MSQIPQAEILLAIDVGSVNTRASLFDIVDGRYRLVATSRAVSTSGPPLFDIGEGVRLALDQIQETTGRKLMDDSDTLITPTTGYGAGVDLFPASSSSGPRVRAVLVGLMPGVSLRSLRRLADSMMIEVVDEIYHIDRRRKEEQVDAILQAQPDLIMIGGGTEGGARDPMLQILDVVNIALGLMPDSQRPKIVYSGNRSLGALVVDHIGEVAQVSVTPNIRPTLPIEDISPARLRLAETLFEIQGSHIVGFEELRAWSNGTIVPTAEAFFRIVRYLSQIYDPDKGVLGVDLGAAYTTIAAAFSGESSLSVNGNLGMGTSLPGLFEDDECKKVMRWLPKQIDAGTVRDYAYNKMIYPSTVPTELDELAMEYAFARQVIRKSLFQARQSWPAGFQASDSVLLPPVEPILASGTSLARAPRPGFTALVLLDALQPCGITTLVLDPYGLAPALGTAASVLPMLSVHVLESGSLANLGTVIAPTGKGRAGKPALTYRLEPDSAQGGAEGEAFPGDLLVLPLPPGAQGKLSLQPERGWNVGFGATGRSGAIRVSGGALGVILDLRGRPLVLPEDDEALWELNTKWLWDIGAYE
jgi:uncharacterized protein (TIGR01319 family)